MNREILFKAKRKDNGEWVEGLPGYDLNGNITELEVYMSFCDCRTYEINPDTICQYTGLTDKNGRKIWENDICEMVYDGVVNTYVIVWDKDELDFKGTNGKEDYGGNFEYLGCCEEIITLGNIFDNLDLLEVK